MNSNQIPSSSKTIEDTNVFSDELDIHPLGDPKLLQGLPKSEAFSGYKVELNGKEMRIFNLRSIRGRIGIDLNRKGDVKLLIHGDNVELLTSFQLV